MVEKSKSDYYNRMARKAKNEDKRLDKTKGIVMSSELWRQVLDYKRESSLEDETDSHVVRVLIKFGLEKVKELKREKEEEENYMIEK